MHYLSKIHRNDFKFQKFKFLESKLALIFFTKI